MEMVAGRAITYGGSSGLSGGGFLYLELRVVFLIQGSSRSLHKVLHFLGCVTWLIKKQKCQGGSGYRRCDLQGSTSLRCHLPLINCSASDVC